MFTISIGFLNSMHVLSIKQFTAIRLHYVLLRIKWLKYGLQNRLLQIYILYKNIKWRQVIRSVCEGDYLIFFFYESIKLKNPRLVR